MTLARQSVTDALCQDVLRCVRFGRAVGRFSDGRVLLVVNCAGFDVCHDGTIRPLVCGVGVSGAGAGLGLRGVTIRTSLV